MHSIKLPRSFWRTRLPVFPPAQVKSQRPIRSTSIIVGLHSTVLQSVPHCMFSLFACRTSAFAVALYLYLTSQPSSLQASEHCELCQRVVGRVRPDVRYVGNHWPNDKVSYLTWTRIQKNTAVGTTNLTLSLQSLETDRDVLWRPTCEDSASTGTSHLTNLKLPTVLIYIEFNTTITLELLTNYTDLISAGVGHNCGHKTSSSIVNVAVDICMIRPLCNTYRISYWHSPALLHLQVLRQKCSSVTVGVGYSPDRRAALKTVIAKRVAKTNVDGD